MEPDGTQYVTGEFKETVDFNRDQEGGIVTSRGESDLFLLRYRPGHHFDWVFGIGSGRSDEVGGLAKDMLGNIYLMGTFEETVDFDPGDGVTALTSAGPDDIFVARYTAARVLRDVRHLPGSSDNTAADIAADRNNHVTLAGMFQGVLDLGNGLVANGGALDGVETMRLWRACRLNSGRPTMRRSICPTCSKVSPPSSRFWPGEVVTA